MSETTSDPVPLPAEHYDRDAIFREDGPFSPLFIEEIFIIIGELKRDGITILLVEQNASAALEVADFAYVLETGEIVLTGAADVVAHDPAIVAAYLGG